MAPKLSILISTIVVENRYVLQVVSLFVNLSLDLKCDYFVLMDLILSSNNDKLR